MVASALLSSRVVYLILKSYFVYGSSFIPILKSISGSLELCIPPLELIPENFKVVSL